VTAKRKICLVIPSLHLGGMERVMSELAGYFSKIEHFETHLTLYGRKPEIFYQIPQDVVIHKPPFVFKNKYQFYFAIKTLFYLRKEIKKIYPDSILSFGEYWNNFVLLALTGLKFPVFVSDRWRPDKTPRFPHNILRKILYARAAGIIVQTHLAFEIYRKFIPRDKIKVIANPIRNIILGNPDEKENIILSAGRLIETKHFDRLIHIFLKLNAPRWKLIIAGGDAIKQRNFEKLNQLIHNFNAQDRILLTGYVNNMDSLYQKSKIFAFTSSSEGFPNVIGEALSAGLPVVAYDCIAGPSEMIQDGVNGFLVPVFDDGAFVLKLQLLIDNEALRNQMSINAVKSIKKFDINKIGKEYLDFILS